jgi:hypothetical protein
MPSHNHGGGTGVPTITLGSFQGTRDGVGGGGNSRIMVSGAVSHDEAENFSTYQISSPTVGASSISSQGGGIAFNVMQPTAYVNYMVKL